VETGKPVLIGVDNTPESARAAAAGWRIAEAEGVPCRLVHVLNHVIAELAVHGSPPTLGGLMVANARKALERSLRGSVPEEVLNTLEIRLGRPSGVLKGLAAESSLLVLGGKRHTALGRWIVGSTVHQLVRDVAAPLLVAGPSGDMPFRILVALDLPSPVEPVLAEARRIARLFRSDLAVLHVIEPIVLSYSPLDPFGVALGDVVSDENWARASEEAFNRAVWPLVDYPMGEKLIRRGPVVDTIRAEVARWRADLLVLGSHGRGWTERLLLGSTTHKLLGDLPTSVLVVPVGKAVATGGAPAPVLTTAFA
jgi:nucleotide-binding universal stress UspA family protein